MPDGLKMKYFVLNPTKTDAYGAASRAAMDAYAESICDTNLDLAEELREWVRDLDQKQGWQEGMAGRKP